MIPAPAIPRAATPLVAVVLVLVAGLGGYFGYSHAALPPGGGDSASSVAATAVAAKAATPIPDSAPIAAVPDEAFIRRIAREEAEAVLHPKHAAPPPDAADDASDDPSASYQPASGTAQPSAAPASASQPQTPPNATQPPPG